MNSQQLSESTSDELNGHGIYLRMRADDNLFFAKMDLADLQRRLPPPTPTELEVATKRVEAAKEGIIRAELAKQSALLTAYFPTDRAPWDESLANFDILHRQQMIGEWPFETNQAVVDEAMNRAGKLSKRRFRKNKTKTKRRRMHKNTKRGRIN